jgi:hypothetical protein
MNQYALGGLSLAGMARHGIAMIEMGMFTRIELHVAASVHLQAHLSVLADGFHCS